MAISKKQMELDVKKWEKSVAEGKDACGSFDYCVACDKSLENPCDKAFAKFNKKPAKKAPAKKEVKVEAKIEVKPIAKAEVKPVAKQAVPAKKTTKK